jgi:hypothetical protein
MVRVRRRKERTPSIDSESTSSVAESNVPPLRTSMVHATQETDTEIESEDTNPRENSGQSNVWKFAKKIGLDKVRCNICEAGR